MHVPFADIRRQHLSIRREIDAAVRRVVEQASFISGPEVDAFEEAFAEAAGARHVVSCANGTDALELALHAMGAGPGDEVIVPALTWISTAEAVSRTGATVVFADVDEETLLIDPEDVERRITDRTRILLPVHLYGQMAPMPELAALAGQHGLAILEDAAQAHGATLHGRPPGAWGRAATFSFYPSKNLGAWGDAGAVVTDDGALARAIRLRARHGQERKHEHLVEGRNSRLDGIQAAVLSAKLPHLDRWNELRRRHAARYDEALAAIETICTPARRAGARHVFHLYVVQTDARDALCEHLSSAGICTAVHYPTPLPFQPCYRHRGYAPSDFPAARRASQRILSLPLFPEMEQREIDHVVSSIRAFDHA